MRQPFIYNRTSHGSDVEHCTVWVVRRHHVLVKTTSYFARAENITTVHTEHFYDGRWERVLPWHHTDVIATDASKDVVLEAHRALLDKTIYFLEGNIENSEVENDAV